MESIQTSTSASASSKKPVREPPSVPFLWEVRPGLPKKDWKPETSVPIISSVPTVPPVKLIASVPFKWEEKPGIPLPTSYSQTSQALVVYGHYMPSRTYVDIDESLDHLWTDSEVFGDDDDNQDDHDDDDDQNMSLFSETSYSYSSAAPSLLANRLVPSRAISAAVAAPLTGVNGFVPEPGTISSPGSESERSTSSYATGISSLVGSSFLECLFPLFPPNSGFLGKVGDSSEGENGHKPPELWSQKLDVESNAVKRPTTLGELIMMSRRRSCRRKADQMRKYDMSMELMRGKALGCCGFGNGTKMIDVLQNKRKQLLRLKLVW